MPQVPPEHRGERDPAGIILLADPEAILERYGQYVGLAYVLR